MHQQLYDSYHAAAEAGNALAADVGVAVNAVRQQVDVLNKNDNFHPSEAGSVLAAAVIAQTIRADQAK